MTVPLSYGHTLVTIIPLWILSKLLAILGMMLSLSSLGGGSQNCVRGPVFSGKVNNNLTLGQLHSWGRSLVSTSICPECLHNQTIGWGRIMVPSCDDQILSLIFGQPQILDCRRSLRGVGEGWPDSECYWGGQVSLLLRRGLSISLIVSW